MNILILNRNLDPCLTECYNECLTQRGHQTTVLSKLADSSEYTGNPSKYLRQFDVALAHPVAEDARALHDELVRRVEFRTIIFNIVGESEMNGRLRYTTPLSHKDLIRVIEN